MKKSNNVRSRILAVLLAAAMTGSIVGGSLTAFAADTDSTTAASAINDNEQKILDATSKSLTINGQEKPVAASFIAQAKAYFETVDVTDDQAATVLEKLASFRAYLEETGVYRFSEFSKSQINEFVKRSNEVVEVLELTVAYDFATNKISITDKTGAEVASAQGAVVEATGIKLNKTTLSLQKGKTFTLVAVVEPDDVTDATVKWYNESKGSIVTVKDGLVTAKKAGTTTITAKTADGKYSASVKVTVTNPATGIKLNKTTATIVKGKTLQVTATVSPSDATNKTVKWYNTNSSVATVKNGLITAKKAGTTTITAKTSDGKYSASIKVTVKNPTVAATSIKLSKTSATLGKGKTLTVKATVSPSNTTNKTVKWYNTNSKVATVKNGKITAKAAGTTTITAKTSNGKSASIKVTVKNYPTSIKLNKTTATVKKGKTVTLKATVSPTKNTITTVTWTSSNKNVATVDSKGKVTAKKAGTVTITAKTANGKTAKAKVKVTK